MAKMWNSFWGYIQQAIGVLFLGRYYPEWYGAKGNDPTHDDYTGLHLCIEDAKAAGGTVIISKKFYPQTELALANTSGGLPFAIQGTGRANAASGDSGPAIIAAATMTNLISGTLSYFSIRNVLLDANNKADYALNLSACRDFELKNVVANTGKTACVKLTDCWGFKADELHCVPKSGTIGIHISTGCTVYSVYRWRVQGGATGVKIDSGQGASFSLGRAEGQTVCHMDVSGLTYDLNIGPTNYFECTTGVTPLKWGAGGSRGGSFYKNIVTGDTPMQILGSAGLGVDIYGNYFSLGAANITNSNTQNRCRYHDNYSVSTADVDDWTGFAEGIDSNGINHGTDQGSLFSQEITWAAKTVAAAADRYKLTSLLGTLDLSQSATWDTTSPTNYTVAANRAGKDFYLYEILPTPSAAPSYIVSSNSSAPSGYTTSNSRKKGQFHCLCAAIAHATSLTGWTAGATVAVNQSIRASVWDTHIYRCVAQTGVTGATEPNWASINDGDTIVDNLVTWERETHSLEGYVAGDILPASVQDTKSKPANSPEGKVWVNPVWTNIYLTSGTTAAPTNVYGGTVLKTSGRVFIRILAAIGERVIRRNESVRAALGANWRPKGGAEPTTTGGLTDQDGRRMVSNLGVEDTCGHHNQLVADCRDTSGNIFLVGGSYGAPTANSGPYWVTGNTEIDTSTICRGCCPPA